MSYFPKISIDSYQDNYRDFKTIFDGQTHFIEPIDKFNTYESGTGAVTYNSTTQKYDLTVTASGDVAILQQTFNNPYFAGNKQLFDITMEYMQPVSGLKKYYGYFDWNDDAPTFANIDGIVIETDDTTVSLNIYNDGNLIHSQDLTALADWGKFNVFTCFFLWLGGAVVEPYLWQSDGSVLDLPNYSHVGQAGQFIKNPSKPITMAVVSTGGAGFARYICSMAATKQIAAWSGVQKNIYMEDQVSVGSVGNYYHLKSVRINPDYKRGTCIQIEELGLTTASTSDSGILFVTRGISLSLTFANLSDSLIQESTDQEGTSVSLANIGDIIAAFPFNSNAPFSQSFDYIGRFFPTSIDLDTEPYSFVYLSQTSNQTAALVARFTELR